ncbi:hypothetical protein Tco_1464239 [Tanacetum coccineum]
MFPPLTGCDRLVIRAKVMSTPTYVDLETITQADRAQSSRVPIPLPDDPYVAVRQAQLVNIDTDEEFKASEPSGTRTVSSNSLVSSDSTTPLSPDHPLTHVSPTPTPTRVSYHCMTARMTVHVQPAMSPGHSTRVAEVMALSDLAFCKRYRSSYEKPSSSSLALRVQKRYRGTSEVILDTDSEGDELGEDNTKEGGLKDEGPGIKEEEEEDAPEGQQQAVPVVDTSASEPLGLGYRAARHRALESTKEIAPSTYEVGQSSRVYTDIPTYALPAAPVQTPPSPEWSSGSLPISPSSSVVPSPIASPVATTTAIISVDEDHFLEVGAQLELYGSILHDHTQRLDALPPTFIANIDRHRYRFRSLEQERERTTVTFGALWRPMLALEAWAGHQAAMQRELQEIKGHVTALEQERGRKDP